ncbi:MAG: RIP metalloprotease RseP [Desulfobacterales bacterium]|jgi:regulator of sigma E protease
MGNSILAFIVVLGVLIFFHELGHFLVARFFGVGVEKFSLGFGPRLFGWQQGMTDYRISLIPLGGYVKMVGDEPDADIDPELKPLSFPHQSVGQRFLIVAAGPLFNLILAVVIFYGVFVFTGIYVHRAAVGEVGKDTPAEKAGIQPGDLVVDIDGVAIPDWDGMKHQIGVNQGKPMSITVDREGKLLTMDLTPQLRKIPNLFGERIERYVIGITSKNDYELQTVGPLKALVESVQKTYEVTALTVVSVVKLIQGKLPATTIGGPIKIAKMAGAQAKEGLVNLLVFTAVISVNLGILNFLPIPVLDGGHLMFFTIEAATRRPVSTKIREISQQIGIFLLILLMIFVIYNDIANP